MTSKMILKHPLNKHNEANKKAIEKYKDRSVYVYNGFLGLWLGDTGKGWVIKASRALTTFKQALKRTKTYTEEAKIEYHFYSKELSEFAAPTIIEYDELDIYNCPSVVFETNKPLQPIIN